MIERRFGNFFINSLTTIIMAVNLSFFGTLAAGAEAPAPEAKAPAPGAAWELKMLGVNDDAKLKELRDAKKLRRVKLGVVGQGGVSKERLKNLLNSGGTITFHNCKSATKSTHDTGQLNVILDISSALGVGVDVHIWQPGKSARDVAKDFRKADKVCDVICFYQSFWGKSAKFITEALRESSSALIISPYVAVGKKPTGEAPQGSACKPWEKDSIENFVLAVPLARKDLKRSPLDPYDRSTEDTEAVNFITPSYYASSRGGTCPAGATTTACAVFLYSVMPEKPTPKAVIDILRSTSGIDRRLLLSAGMDEAAIDAMQKKIDSLIKPAPGKQRKLDAPGIVNLFKAYQKATAK
jgi:hypothetical protein